MTKECLNCKKELAKGRRKFCCQNCSSIWQYHNNPKQHDRIIKNAHDRWNRNKDNEAFKLANCKKAKEWREKFPDKWYALNHKGAQGKWMAARRQRLKAEGLCPRCGNKIDALKFKACFDCRFKASEWYKKRQLKKKEEKK